MIRRDHCIQLFLDTVPELTEAWQMHLECRDNAASTRRNDIAELGSFLAARIVSFPEKTVRNIFRVAETCLAYGDVMVKSAIAGRFFDALIGGPSANEFIAEALIPFLGDHSLAFSKAWDALPTPCTAGVAR